MTVQEWLAKWDELEVTREEISQMYEAGNGGDTAQIYAADEAGTELMELESDLAKLAEQIFRGAPGLTITHTFENGTVNAALTLSFTVRSAAGAQEIADELTAELVRRVGTVHVPAIDID